MGDSSEVTNGETSPLEQKIIHQVEYYFGDLNLPKDKFLQAELKKDDGWVPLDTMTKFNRLKTLSADNSVIAAALRKSKSGILEVDDEGKKIRRLKPLPENSLEYWQDVKSRTVYVKRFPETITLDQLQEFFKTYGDVERVIMRFYKSDQQRNFKGSVFVTFPTREEAKKFVELEDIKHVDEVLVRLMQDQYFKEKTEESKRRKEERRNQHRNGDQSKDEQEKPNFTSGRVLHLTGIPKEGVTLDNIRELFIELQKPEWIDNEKGSDEAFIRFENQANSAEDILKRVLESKGGKLTLGDAEITAEVVTGEAEQQYWERTQKARKDAREQKSGGGGGGGGRGRGGRGRGGRGGGRGRGRGRGRQEKDIPRQNKKIRFSSGEESDVEENAQKEHRSAAKRSAPVDEEGTVGKKPKNEGEVKTE